MPVTPPVLPPGVTVELQRHEAIYDRHPGVVGTVDRSNTAQTRVAIYDWDWERVHWRYGIGEPPIDPLSALAKYAAYLKTKHGTPSEHAGVAIVDNAQGEPKLHYVADMTVIRQAAKLFGF